MKSLNTSIQNKGPALSLSKGFSITEILIVIGIIGFIAVIGVIIGIDSYQRYLLRSDLDKSAIFLQSARSSAMNNVGESSHGVYFGDSDEFIIFRGDNYATRDPNFDIEIDKSPAVTVNFTSGADEVVFTSLSGISTEEEITLSDGTRSLVINVNNEGEIDW